MSTSPDASKSVKALKGHKCSKSKPTPILGPIYTTAANLKFGYGDLGEPQTTFRSRAASSPAVMTKSELPFDLHKDFPSLVQLVQQLRDMESDTDTSETGATGEEKDEHSDSEHAGSAEEGSTSSRAFEKREPLTASLSTQTDTIEQVVVCDDIGSLMASDPGHLSALSPTHPDDRRERVSSAVYEEMMQNTSHWPELSPLVDSDYEENMRKAQSIGIAKRSKKGKRSDVDAALEDHVLEAK